MHFRAASDHLFYGTYDRLFGRCGTWLAFMTASRVVGGEFSGAPSRVGDLEFVMGYHARLYDIVRTRVWRQMPGH